MIEAAWLVIIGLMIVAFVALPLIAFRVGRRAGKSTEQRKDMQNAERIRKQARDAQTDLDDDPDAARRGLRDRGRFRK